MHNSSHAACRFWDQLVDDVRSMSRRVGTYREPTPDKGRHAVSDPFLRQLVQGNCSAKLRRSHAELTSNAHDVETELLKRSKALPESLAALLQAFDAGASLCRDSHLLAAFAHNL